MGLLLNLPKHVSKSDIRQYLEEEGDESDVQTLAHHSKRRREDSQQSNNSSTIINFLSPFHIWNINDIVPYLENLVQKVVKEVLDSKLSPRPINNETATCEPKFFRLVFKNELSAEILTFSKIKSKDDNPVKVTLDDVRSHSIVAEGPLSSIKIEICVLNSEFGSDGSEDWSADEFKAKIIRQRDNKGKLLKGNTVITLKHGVGYIPNNVVFTDNSRWTRSRRFRLGAKVVQSTNLNVANIREGISAPFIVKDCRGELNQKRFPPFLNDKLWRLKCISKDGIIHQRLTNHGINTVGHLLQLHETNPSSLQKAFGKTNKKQREAIIDHAKTSVAEATFDGQNYNSQDIFNSHEKALEMPAIETTTHDQLAKTSTSIQTAQYNAPDQGLQQLNDFLIPQQEENSWQMPLQWSAEEQFVPTYLDDGNI